MDRLIGMLPWAGLATMLLALLIMFRRPLRSLFALALRTLAGLGALLAFSYAGGLIGVTLGVNFINALVLGVLGAPGFALLLLLRWGLSL